MVSTVDSRHNLRQMLPRFSWTSWSATSAGTSYLNDIGLVRVLGFRAMSSDGWDSGDSGCGLTN